MTTIKTRYEWQAQAIEEELVRDLPLYETKRDGCTIDTEATLSQVYEAIGARGIRKESLVSIVDDYGTGYHG